MGFFDFFRSAPQKQTLESLTLEDLNRERLTCQQELTKVEREQAKLLKDEEQLKNEYASATADFQKRSIARRIQDGRMQQKQVEGWINAVNKNLRVVNNFIMIKKNEAFYKRAGVLSILNNMDVADIEHYISQAAVDGALDNDKLVQVLQAQEDGMSQLFANQESDGLDDLMKELDSETAPIREVSMGMKADTELDNLEKELQKQADDGMKNVDRLLNPEM